MKTVDFRYSKVKYDVIRSNRRKTTAIMVDENGVKIRTPIKKSDREIRNLVQSHSNWIFRKQFEFKERKKIRYIPKKYTKPFLIKRVRYYSRQVGVLPLKITIKKMQTRWGSATKDNVISINEYLLKAPKGAIDYVILHEICHLKIKNHSSKFWDLVQKFMPNYMENKKWLEANSTKIVG